MTPAGLTTTRVILRPLMPSDYDFLRANELSEQLGQIWRHRGATPSPEEWVAGLHQGILAQFLVIEVDSHIPIGMVSAYNANARDRWAYVAGARFDPKRRSPTFLLGFSLFLEYLFRNFDFRKLYAESAEYNYGQWSSSRVFSLEAQLKERTYWNGRYWDEFILSVSREHWEEVGHRYLI